MQQQQTYLLVINGRPEGPFTAEQLRHHNIKPGDFVKAAGMDDYKEAHEVAELRGLFGFTKPVFTPQYFGSFDQRLLASAMDWFLVFGTFAILALILVIFIDDKAARITLALSVLGITPVANLVYHIIAESSAKQGTYGKQLLKIRVCDKNGERITLARAAGRNLAKLISTLPFFTGYLVCFFNKQQQCLHDMIADTMVIKDRLF